MAKWIWNPGDFELYHSMLLHNRRRTAGTYNNLNSGKRETNSAYHQPMWRVYGPRHDCALFKKAKIDKKQAKIEKKKAKTDKKAVKKEGKPKKGIFKKKNKKAAASSN